MRRTIQILSLIISSAVFLSCATMEAPTRAVHYDYYKQSHPDVYQLLLQMPQPDDAQRDSTNAALINLGPDKLQLIADLIVPAGVGNDAKPRYALGDLSYFVTQPGLEAERRMYEQVLLAALAKSVDEEEKAFFLRQLEQVGTTNSIDPVSEYLSDTKLFKPAAKTLLSNDSLKSGQVFVNALQNASGDQVPTFLNALGEVGDLETAGVVSGYADSDNRNIRMAALQALGTIGNPASGDILAEAAMVSEPYARAKTTAFYLQYAESLAQRGNRDRAESIYRDLLGSRQGPEDANVRVQALDGLIQILGEDANQDLLNVFSEDGKEVRMEALRLAESLEGDNITGQWIDKVDAVNPERQAEIIAMLGRRGDQAAFQTVLNALSSDDYVVRHAAMQSAVRLNAAESVSELLTVLERTDSRDEMQAVQTVLLQVPGDALLPKVDYRLPNMPAQAQVILLEIIGQQRATNYKKSVMSYLDDPESEVRVEAMNTLRYVGSAADLPVTIDVIIATDDASLRNVAQRTAVSLANEYSSASARVEPFMNRFDSASPEEKGLLLQTLGQLGTQEALQVVSEQSRTGNETVRDAAVRALSNWQSNEAIDPLVRVVRSSNSLTHKVLALQGSLRLISQSDMPDSTKIQRLQTLMQLAPRTREQRMVIGGIGNINSPEALNVITGYLGDPDLQNEAATAILNYAARAGNPRDEVIASQVSSSLLTRIVDDKTAARVREIVNQRAMNTPPDGYTALFNGDDFSGWQGIIADGNPAKKRQMDHKELAKARAASDELMQQHWSVRDGVLTFDGDGYHSIRTIEDYRNFEMLVDWKIEPGADSGLYLRGVPQVQIWDAGENPVGSGGLYNNQIHPSEPKTAADNPVGQWNTFRIRMVDNRVSVWLNGTLVVDAVPLENYWEREKPLPEEGPIWLQAHDSNLYFKNIFIKELPGEERLYSGPLFNGEDLSGWEPIGASEDTWGVDDGLLYTEGEGGGWISTDRMYDNFKLSLEFRLPEGGNSGVFLRTPREGNPAYVGMEIQVLDDYADVYADLQPWQYSGSIYAVQAPAKQATKPAGEWNEYVIVCDGPMVKIWLNGELVNQANLIHHMDKSDSHPGLKRRKGYIGLQNHSTRVDYRNIRIEELK